MLLIISLEVLLAMEWLCEFDFADQALDPRKRLLGCRGGRGEALRQKFSAERGDNPPLRAQP
jgi:hypothetical protein